MKYESNILERLIKTYGVVGNPKYLSEIIKQFIIQGKECYPNLFTYQSDWLSHIDEFGLENDYVVTYTGQRFYAPNTKEKPVKSAILKGSTKYRDIDTGEVLDAFEDGRNLELVSVKMPVLTTSNEDGTKTNILTANEDVVLRGIGDVGDTLDLLTGEYVRRYGSVTITDKMIAKAWTGVTMVENVVYFSQYRSGVVCAYHSPDWTLDEFKDWFRKNKPTIIYELAEPTIKTVDLTIHDKDHQKVERLTSFEGGTHFTTSSQDGSLLPTLTVDVVTDLEETLMVCSLDGNTM